MKTKLSEIIEKLEKEVPIANLINLANQPEWLVDINSPIGR